MKRYAKIFALALCFMLAAAVCHAEYGADDIIYESFDSGLGGFDADNDTSWFNTFSAGVVSDSARGGKVVQLKNSYEYKSIHYNAVLNANMTYKVSFWVKGSSSYSGKQMCVVLKKDGNHTNSLGAQIDSTSTYLMPNYVYAGAENGKAVALTGDWQYVEAYVNYGVGGTTDETGITDVYPVVYTTDGVGNDYTLSKKNRITYLIDDFKIEPMDIIYGEYTESMFRSNSNVKLSVGSENGNDIFILSCRNGTKGQNDGQNDFNKNVNIREGEAYRLTYRAKTSGGTNRIYPILSRYSNKIPRTPATTYQGAGVNTITDTWREYSHTIDAYTETAEGVSYRFPEMVMRVQNPGTVYIDDIKIEKIHPDVHDITVSGECIKGKTVNVSFSAADGISKFIWRIAEPVRYSTIGIETEITSKSFNVTLPEAYDDIIIGIKPVYSDGTSGEEIRTTVSGIAQAYTVSENKDAEEVGVEFPDTVWSPDFETLRVNIILKNKEKNLNGILALYDENENLIRVVCKELSEGVNSVSASTSDAVTAKVMAWDHEIAPQIKCVPINKQQNKKFIYASTNARIFGTGTYDKPCTLEKAMYKAKNQTGDVYVMLKAGNYNISSPLEFTAEHSGNGGNVIYASYGGENGEKATISGGKDITGWELYDSSKNIYRASVSGVDNFRQVYVNGVRAVRARNNIVSKVLTTDETGYTMNDISLLDVRNISDAEFVYYQEWTNPRCGIKSVADNGDGTVKVEMSDYCWNLFLNKEHLVPGAPAFIENAYEFIDTPGEWYYDKTKKYLYYMPRVSENMSTAQVTVPCLETLVNIGGSTQADVANITFKNLEFAYSTWLYPDTYGYSDAQSGRIRDGKDIVPSAAFEARHTNNVNIEDCTFTKLGMSAVNMLWGIKNSHITGSEFKDLSGSGMYLGMPYKYDESIDSSLTLCRGVSVKNNYIHDIGIDYNSCVPIATMYMFDTDVSNNEIADVPYSGIHGGYGFNVIMTGLSYSNNFIHRALNGNLFDGASIYVTGKTGGTKENPNIISGNYIKEQLAAYGGLYTDNSSSGWRMTDNVIDYSMIKSWGPRKITWLLSLASGNNYADNNYTTTDACELLTSKLEDPANDPGVFITNHHVYPNADWPAEAQAFISNAGLVENYSARLADKYQFTKSAQEEITVKRGMTKPLPLYGEGGKSGVTEAKYIAYGVCDAADVAEVVNENGVWKIKGKNAGNTTANIYTVTDGCIKCTRIKINVY